MSRLRPLLRPLVILAAFVVFAGAWRTAVAPGLRSPPSAAVDFLPLWLGAALVEQGKDPNDAGAAAAQFQAEELPLRPGGFYSYYPPTAPLAALPLRPLGFRGAVTFWRLLGGLSLVGGTFAAALSGFRGRPPPTAGAVACLVTALVLISRPARIVFPTGQPGPLVVGLTGFALWFVSRAKGHAAGAVIAMGAAVKLLPVVVLPVLLLRRQWAAAVVFLGVGFVLVGVLVGFGVPLDPIGWARGVSGFVGHEALPSWGNQPWLLAAWRVRVGVVTIGAALVLARLRWRPRPGLELDAAAVLVASVGVVMAGTHHYHEALVLMPAFAHALAWPAQEPKRRGAWVAAAVLLAACASQPKAFSRSGRPDSLVWVGLGLTIWAVTVVRGLAPPFEPAERAVSD